MTSERKKALLSTAFASEKGTRAAYKVAGLPIPIRVGPTFKDRAMAFAVALLARHENKQPTRNAYRWKYNRSIKYHYYENHKYAYAHIFRASDGLWHAETPTACSDSVLLRDAKAFVEHIFNRRHKQK